MKTYIHIWMNTYAHTCTHTFDADTHTHTDAHAYLSYVDTHVYMPYLSIFACISFHQHKLSCVFFGSKSDVYTFIQTIHVLQTPSQLPTGGCKPDSCAVSQLSMYGCVRACASVEYPCNRLIFAVRCQPLRSAAQEQN